MPRMFTAIEIPLEIRDELHRLQLPVPGARWIEPENYHLTLRFAGDIEGPVMHEFVANLSEIEIDAFELTVLGLGAFGGNDPSAIWAGIAPSEPLEALARAHEKAARNAGLLPVKRPFKPHITLARLLRSRPEDVARYLNQYSGYRSEPFFVTQSVLMSSRPNVGGGPYGIAELLPLRGGTLPEVFDDDQW